MTASLSAVGMGEPHAPPGDWPPPSMNGTEEKDDSTAADTPEGESAATEEGSDAQVVPAGIYVLMCRMCGMLLCRAEELLQDAINNDPSNGSYFVEVNTWAVHAISALTLSAHAFPE